MAIDTVKFSEALRATVDDINRPIVENQKKQNLTEGVQYDEGKDPYHLIPFDALAGVVTVFAYGANKYAPRNWEKGLSWGHQYGSILRHLFDWFRGKEIDQESGLSHLDLAATRLLMLSASVKRNIGTDDRVKL
jgi:hypothetical protein